jgi:hypothetical protein
MIYTLLALLWIYSQFRDMIIDIYNEEKGTRLKAFASTLMSCLKCQAFWLTLGTTLGDIRIAALVGLIAQIYSKYIKN